MSVDAAVVSEIVRRVLREQGGAAAAPPEGRGAPASQQKSLI